jgi:hypothetical protein
MGITVLMDYTSWQMFMPLPASSLKQKIIAMGTLFTEQTSYIDCHWVTAEEYTDSIFHWTVKVETVDAECSAKQ